MVTMEMTETALPQHLKALRKANRARLAGAEVKREVRAGSLTVAEALEDPRAGSLPVIELLKAPHRMGEALAKRTLRRAEAPDGRPVIVIPERKAVRDLTERQRRRIIEALPRVARGVDVSRLPR